MAEFEYKAGSFSLFPNEKKTKDSQPDFTGKGVSLDNKKIQFSVWLKEGRKGKFMSGQIKIDDYVPQQVKAQPKEDLDDIIPF